MVNRIIDETRIGQGLPLFSIPTGGLHEQRFAPSIWQRREGVGRSFAWAVTTTRIGSDVGTKIGTSIVILAVVAIACILLITLARCIYTLLSRDVYTALN